MADDWHAIETLIMTYAERLDLGDFAAVAELFAHATYRADRDGATTEQRGADAVRRTLEGLVRRYHDRFEKVDGAWRFADRLVFSDLVGDLSQHLTVDVFGGEEIAT